MCGIAGILSFEGNSIDPSSLRAMADAIAHRGPDDEGYVLVDSRSGDRRRFAGRESHPEIRGSLPPLPASGSPIAADVGLAHRRFSIIEPGAAAHQPFLDADGECCVVFNGEIYNHVELRAELAAGGARFRTRSDTEVLVESYRRWGTDCFDRFDGFWALALYDFRRRRLILSRDRLGKKPLYWARAGAQLVFASEIKALLGFPALAGRRRANPAAVYDWLVNARKDGEDSTFFDGIHSFPAASWAIADERFSGDAVRYWQVPTQRMQERDIGVGEAATRVRELLTDAVRLRLRADVPIALELSGGLDSSALAAVARELTGDSLTAYTVRYPDPALDEEPFARAVASRLGLQLCVLDAPDEDFWTTIRPFTWLHEEPYHAPNVRSNQVVWERMRAMGTKVSLNGAAGDELFAGYARYFDVAQLENAAHARFDHLVDNARGHSEATSPLQAWLGPGRALAMAAGRAVVPRRIQRALRGKGFVLAPTHRRRVGAATLSSMLHRDMTSDLMPYWLASGDRGSMGVPVEVRAPFLDHRLVEFAYQLPITYLIRDGWHKWILRKAVEELLPNEVVWRRRKLGFPFPFERFYSENAPLIGRVLRESDNPYIAPSALPVLSRDWRAISFLLWYELFVNGNEPLLAGLARDARARTPRGAQGFESRFLRSCA